MSGVAVVHRVANRRECVPHAAGATWRSRRGIPARSGHTTELSLGLRDGARSYDGSRRYIYLYIFIHRVDEFIIDVHQSCVFLYAERESEREI